MVAVGWLVIRQDYQNLKPMWKMMPIKQKQNHPQPLGELLTPMKTLALHHCRNLMDLWSMGEVRMVRMSRPIFLPLHIWPSNFALINDQTTLELGQATNGTEGLRKALSALHQKSHVNRLRDLVQWQMEVMEAMAVPMMEFLAVVILPAATLPVVATSLPIEIELQIPIAYLYLMIGQMIFFI